MKLIPILILILLIAVAPAAVVGACQAVVGAAIEVVGALLADGPAGDLGGALSGGGA